MALYARWMVLLVLKALQSVDAIADFLRPTARLVQLTVAADALETALVLAMLTDPARIDSLARWASIFNQCKWLLAYVTMGGIVVAGGMLLGQALVRRKKID
jgi:hypothetical protein